MTYVICAALFFIVGVSWGWAHAEKRVQDLIRLINENEDGAYQVNYVAEGCWAVEYRGDVVAMEETPLRAIEKSLVHKHTREAR